ncbi:MAG: hypothetical protein HYV63_12765 [Candidatus Schekmanbacteria bacterium]|nr:hypothetical protein [Candidatus Schekmanbacteria bacterium]
MRSCHHQHHRHTIDRQVTPAAVNVLKVTLAGKPGSWVRVELLGELSAGVRTEQHVVEQSDHDDTGPLFSPGSPASSARWRSGRRAGGPTLTGKASAAP